MPSTGSAFVNFFDPFSTAYRATIGSSSPEGGTMTTLLLALMMQYVISTKAGLVNYVQGPTNVKVTQSVPMGVPIRTGSEGFAEILLNPGSFLRLGQNSEAVLQGIQLVNVSVRLNSGTAVVEAVGFDEDAPLEVVNGDLKVKII